MNEEVLPFVLTRDEAEALLIVEPLHGPGGAHRSTPRVVLCAECGDAVPADTQRARDRSFRMPRRAVRRNANGPAQFGRPAHSRNLSTRSARVSLGMESSRPAVPAQALALLTNWMMLGKLYHPSGQNRREHALLELPWNNRSRFDRSKRCTCGASR